MTAEKKSIETLQALRFLAALLVVIYHVFLHYQARKGTLPVQFNRYISFVGVDIFFVISGYVMWRTTASRSAMNDAARFLYNRCVRIFAGYWPIIAVLFAIMAIHEPQRLAMYDWLSAVLLFPVPGNLRPLDVNWTLIFEMLFYATMAVGIAFRSRRNVMLAFTVAVIVIAILPKSGFYALRFFQNPIPLEFLAGCFVAYLLERPSDRGGPTFLILGVTLILGSGMLFMVRQELPGPWERVLTYGLASALIVFGTVRLDSKVRTPHSMVVLGDSSYAIYLLHVPILTFVWHHLPSSYGVWFFYRNLEIGAAVIVVATLALSVVYHYQIERPLMKFGRNVSLARSPKPEKIPT